MSVVDNWIQNIYILMILASETGNVLDGKFGLSQIFFVLI